MSGFMSVPAELRAAAGRVDELATDVARADLGVALADTARAVPGGQAAPVEFLDQRGRGLDASVGGLGT